MSVGGRLPTRSLAPSPTQLFANSAGSHKPKNPKNVRVSAAWSNPIAQGSLDEGPRFDVRRSNLPHSNTNDEKTRHQCKKPSFAALIAANRHFPLEIISLCGGISQYGLFVSGGSGIVKNMLIERRPVKKPAKRRAPFD